MACETMLKLDIKKANALLNSKTSDNVTEGLLMVSDLLRSHQVDTYFENFIPWTDVLARICIKCEKQSATHLASFLFNKLLKMFSVVPAASREISSNKVNIILSNFLQYNAATNSPLPVLQALHGLLTTFPAPCGNLKYKIIKFISPFILSDINSISIISLKCWAQIPLLGSAGVQHTEHVKHWKNQMEEVISLLRNTLGCYVGKNMNLESNGIMGISSIFLDSLPTEEPKLSHCLVTRYNKLCDCLKEMLTLNFPLPLPVPFHKLMSILTDCLNLTPKSFGFTSEMLERLSKLHEIQCQSLEILSVLFRICQNHMCFYGTSINEIFLNLLDQWENKTIRTKIYKVSQVWIETCSSLTNFMVGTNLQSKLLSQHLEYDIHITQELQQNSFVSKHPKKSKRKIKNGFEQNLNKPINESNLSSETVTCTINALKTANLCFLKSGEKISVQNHKIFQKMTVIMLIKIQQGISSVHLFCSSNKVRLLFYKFLLTLILNHHPKTVPPVGYGKTIFHKGLNDHSNEIKNLCKEALLVCSSTIYSNYSSVHCCNINLDEEEVKSEGTKVYTSEEKEHLDVVDSEMDKSDDANSKWLLSNVEEEMEKDEDLDEINNKDEMDLIGDKENEVDNYNKEEEEEFVENEMVDKVISEDDAENDINFDRDEERINVTIADVQNEVVSSGLLSVIKNDVEVSAVNYQTSESLNILKTDDGISVVEEQVIEDNEIVPIPNNENPISNDISLMLNDFVDSGVDDE